MDLKKVIENLRVKSDVCLLEREELIDKYGSDKKSYNDFLEIFARVFSRRRIFPLIVSFKYRDIEALLEAGDDFVVDDTEIFQVSILREIYKNEHQTYLDIRGDDYGQAIAIFNDSIGAHKVKSDCTSVGEKMAAMCECAEIYRDCDKSIDMETFDVNVDEFLEKNPQIKLCYNNNFLYFANYLLTSYTTLCDEEFLDFVRNVIDISLVESEFMPQNFSESEYLKLSKFTLQKIDALEKSRSKEENPKRKILDIFKKNS